MWGIGFRFQASGFIGFGVGRVYRVFGLRFRV